ncbi:T9SS type B sorting domain-containing protein [Flavobacterium sp.]|uniref:T9SS type B sorting domain-containing protein n=1 Tax=Flavobacterium sp. TaxID=239 RepID=UPI0037501BCA
MKLKLILYFFLIPLLTFAQREANIWYFGNHAGLDFNSGSPVALTNGQLNTQEGCAVLSNSAGQLLFYTDGSTVYNKNHVVMLNGTGLLGHSSSAQSATIVPKPGSTTLFYIFTTDNEHDPNGFRYSIVDLSLDSGLGAVTSNKNVLVYTPTIENLAITKHANGTDYWIITHGWNNNSFHAYLLTASGLSAVPITTNIGNVVAGIGFVAAGITKISPSGSKLAFSSVSDFVQLFDFNNSNGIISNPQTLLSEFGELYGLEFSPNESVLYVTNSFYYDTNAFFNKVYQFNLLASNISASKLELYSGPLTPGQLQLGPDGKIYLAVYNQTKLSVINNPDIVGLGCNFQLNAIDLGGKISMGGLPSFSQSFFFNPTIQFDNACVGQSTQLTFNTNQTILNTTWDFGDGTPTSNNIIANHIYTVAGTYTVSVVVTSPLGIGTNTRTIVISDVPTATQPQNMLPCDNNNNGLYNFDLTTRNLSILNGQNASLYTVKYFANATDYAKNIAIATPSSYQNATAYQQQTIIAEVSNNANSDCKATTTFNIDVFDTPLPNLPANILNLTSCDNTTVGTDTDGKVIFNLTQRANAILNGQLASQFTITYYRDAALTNQILTPTSYQNTNPAETIYVKVANNDNTNCVATTSFNLQVFSLPFITTIVDLKQCDDNTDGFSIFNLTEANAKILTNITNETFSYFETANDAQSNINPIPNFTTYTNQIVSNDVIYVRVSNDNGCFRVAQLNLIVSTTQVPVTFTRNFTQCDDAISGTNTDGISAFNFSSVDTEVRNLFPVNQLLTITYYRKLADALAESNAITNISNYRNIGYPNTQNIYTRVDSDLNNDCLLLKSFITLNVERIPIVSPIVRNHCDDNQDGKYGFDTSNLQTTLLNSLTNVTVTYFDQNNNPLPSPLPNPFVTASQTIKVVVTNNTAKACSYETTIQFVVDDLPEAFSIPTTLATVCDDEANPINQNGLYSFDTSTFQNTILGSQTGMVVNYFDAVNNPLPSPLPNPFVTGTQNVRVDVISPINTVCKATYTIVFVVKQVPNINLLGDELVCNEQTISKTIDAGLLDPTQAPNYTYVWKLNGNPTVIGTNYTLKINQAGIYTVAVSNSLNCPTIRTITVAASDKATITSVNVVDLTTPNSITVYVTGAGNYVYAIDDINGLYQDENVFANVSAGIHTVYIKDLNGCGVVPKEVAVLGIPDYFTPNGDGYNDYWNIKGANSTLNAKTIIYIFDRFGKLIKQITPTSQGWNGTFNNQALPATDYWYSVELEDGKTVKGHFALKR